MAWAIVGTTNLAMDFPADQTISVTPPAGANAFIVAGTYYIDFDAAMELVTPAFGTTQNLLSYQGGTAGTMSNFLAYGTVTSTGAPANLRIKLAGSSNYEEGPACIIVWLTVDSTSDWVREAKVINIGTSGPTGSVASSSSDLVLAWHGKSGGTESLGQTGWSIQGTAHTIRSASQAVYKADTAGASNTTATMDGAIGYPALSIISVKNGGGAPDTEVPTLTGSITETGKTTNSISISWPAGSDNVAVTGYEVSRDGGTIWTSLGNVLTYTFTGLSAGTPYAIRVRAKDGAGNVSTPALETSITTLAPDTTVPTLVGSITVGAKTSTTISMSWPSGTDNVGVTSYEVSRDGGSTWVDVGNVLTYQFTGLTALTSYGLRVRAKDGAGNVSTPALSATTSTYRAGALGSTILLTTGPVDGNQAGILYNDVQAGDEGKWFSFYIVTPPATGTLNINPDGTFDFTGAEAATFTYQLEVDGVAFGDPVLVTLYNTTTYRPISDGTTTGWSTTGASFFGALNETPASDASYVTSPAVAGTPGPLVMGINPIAAGTYVARFRARRTLTVGEVRQVFLTSGDVEVGATAWQALTNSFALYEPTVTLTGTAAKVRLEVRE